MHYYEVWVASQRYHSDKPLTYASKTALRVGTVVIVPLQKQVVAAVVIRRAKKPSFETKNIKHVVSATPLPRQLLDLANWLKDYYPAPFGQILSTVLPSSLTVQRRSVSTEDDPRQAPKKSLPLLTEEQATSLQAIRAHSPRSILLHGDTGTGKTRVYLERARECINQNQSVILLTPEIGLTPQLALTCQEIFPDNTVVLHSNMTAATRRNVWLRIIESKEPLIIIGPRSALFAPVKHLGLIVIDEFHETSYKQEQAPHYLATRVGAKLAEAHQAQLILGSATPLISDYYAFQKKQLPIVRMQKPAVKHEYGESDIQVIDLKNRQNFTRSAWLSDVLIDAIKRSINNQQQALIFLNRRGTARLVLCQECGWQTLCPNCDLPLTYHGDSHMLHCHTCGHTSKAPTSCPECGSNDVIFRSIGTKTIVSEIERLIPSAKVGRFDSDTPQLMSLEQQYSAVKTGSVDILVGTQMLGKGLDLPKLSVVGIVTAETSLSFPDYTAEERTFQLITQAIGRVNRGHVAGTAIVQSHHPNNPIIQAAVSKNYAALYEQQIQERKLYKFPPFRHVLKLTCTRASTTSAKRASSQLYDKLRTAQLPIEIIGPSPAFIEKSHNKFHWQLVVKATDRQVLVKIIQNLPANWSYDVDPMNLL